MRLLSVLLLCFITTSSFGQKIYQSESFVVHLKEDSSFIYYPKEVSLKGLVAGDYHLHQDSLILTTHEGNGETVIFAIYNLTAVNMSLIYAQKEFRKSLSQKLYINKELFSNNKVKEAFYWSNQSKGDYSLYQFSLEGYLLSVENFENNVLEGKQLYFYPKRQSLLQKESHYKNGLLHRNAYYYDIADEKSGKLAMVLKEKYKNGKLVKSKKPVTPPIFYTARF